MKFVDPMGFWSIWVQEYASGNTNVYVEYDNSKLLSTIQAGVNALPFGSTVDYSGRMEDFAGFLTAVSDGYGGLTKIYKYRPDDELVERIKKWDTMAPTVSDILDKAKVYENVAEKLSSSTAKNIIRNAAPVITAGFSLYDLRNKVDAVKKDRYLRGMIRAAGLEDTIEKINNPADLYIIMTFIEAKLNSYGVENYKICNKYFADSYLGIYDYDIEPSWWDNILGNYDSVKKDIEKKRGLFKIISGKIRRDFDSTAGC